MAAPKRKTSKPAKSSGARILLVEARFYDAISDALLAGAAQALDEAHASWDSIVVPGALEIVPAIAIAIEAAARNKKPYDGTVALGCAPRCPAVALGLRTARDGAVCHVSAASSTGRALHS